MTYSKFGNVFKEIRQSKNLSLSYFSKIGISKSALSKFERGESMMNFENVANALELMDIPLSDFFSYFECCSLAKQPSKEEIKIKFINGDIHNK